MNERIKELAEQADIVFGFDKNGDPEVICSNMDIEKFAELIVRECAKFSYAYTSNHKNVRDWDEHGWDCLPGDLRDAIKEHFGVEE